ncbi:response regulator transcription factor [Pseudoalteromonas denitrificans]|jgi:DNA-binding CsgD family transcriptional regulator|uniref:Regulatory protein, luxR family n=1 Tax=Pseudoalteromonas denitrificans DSM 6059 TaxID=1123010 RepID=A0A1I1IIX8_9GAMM|nr:LuxR C-terminal-related transcriptional regulator [Pseudoalteromonas denitrificans]SFC36299.1 regulatory protein, luxR family [Pseudoalteromonas denitrificans DSM 6059]
MEHSFSSKYKKSLNTLYNAASLVKLKSAIFSLSQELGFNGIFITGLSQVGESFYYISDFPTHLLPEYNNKSGSHYPRYYEDALEQCQFSNNSVLWHEVAPIQVHSGSILGSHIAGAKAPENVDTVQGVSIPTFSNKGSGFISFYYSGAQTDFLKFYTKKHLELIGIAQIIFQQLCLNHPDVIFEKPKLTVKSKECLHFMSKGFTNIEISRLMHVSKDRVKELVSGILDKLEAANRTEAVMIAASNNII